MGIAGPVVGAILGNESSRHASNTAADAQVEAAQIAAKAQTDMFNQMMGLQQPYHQAGVNALGQLPGTNPMGNAQQYMDRLQGSPGLNLPQLNLDSFSYSFNPNDPTYKYRQQEMQKTIDQAAAARGNYNSRAAINAQGEGNMALTADESEKQFQRALESYKTNTSSNLAEYDSAYQRSSDLYNTNYGKNMDLFNMSSNIGAQNYNSLIDLVKIGQGSASSAGSGALATGQGLSNIYGQMGNSIANNALRQGQIQSDMWSNLGNEASGSNWYQYYNMFGGGK